MRIRLTWAWDMYFLLYLFYVFGLVFTFFAPISPINFYYRVLVAFDAVFLLPYFLNLLSVILNFLSIFPLYSFIQRTPTFSFQFCRWLFVFRIVADILGRSYERNLIKAFAYQSPKIALLMLGLTVLWVIPSYWALFNYGFREKARS